MSCFLNRFLVFFFVFNSFDIIDASWSGWSSWGSCELRHFTGRVVQTRTRTCSGTCTGDSFNERSTPCLHSEASFYGLSSTPTSIPTGSSYMKSALRLNQVLVYPSFNFQFDVFSNYDVLGLPTVTISALAYPQISGRSNYVFTDVKHITGQSVRSTTKFSNYFSSRTTEVQLATTTIKPVITPYASGMLTSVWSFQRSATDNDNHMETYFIHQDIFTKSSSSSVSTKGVIEMQNTKAFTGKPGRPSEFKFEVNLRTYATDVKMIIHFDSTFQVASTDQYTFLFPEVTTVEKFPELNKVILTFSYVVDTVLFGMEALIQAAKKNIDYNGRISNHYIMRVTWCEEVQPCTASQMKTTLPVRSTRTFTSMVETGVGWPEPGMRIKSRRTGRCLTLNPDDNYNSVIFSSTCRDNFMLTADSRLIHKGTGKEVLYRDPSSYAETNVSLTSYPIAFSEHNNILINVAGDTVWRCLEAIPDIDGARFYRAEFFQHKCRDGNQNIFNLLQGYPEEVMNKLGMKGVLKVDSPLGLTVVLCQPTGDLATKFNCYYTLNLDTKWKGITPLMTYVGFYQPTSKLFYGYCYKAKHYCSYDIQRDIPTAISEDDYIALLGDFNIVSTEKLDDMSLGANTNTTLPYPELAAKSHTLFFSVDGQWESRAVFRN